MTEKIAKKERALIFLAVTVFSLFFFMSSLPSVHSLPIPTGIYGYIQSPANTVMNISVFAYENDPQNDYLAKNKTGFIIKDFKQTFSRESDGAYMITLTTDISPNLDIVIIAVSEDASFHTVIEKRNVSPGDQIRLDYEFEEESGENPPEIEVPQFEGPSGGSSSGGGSSGGGDPVIDTERKEMPPGNMSDDEDLDRYLKELYNQTEEEHVERKKEELEKEEEKRKNQQEEEEAERQYNLMLEHWFYLVLVAVLLISFFTYKKIHARSAFSYHPAEHNKRRFCLSHLGSLISRLRNSPKEKPEKKTISGLKNYKELDKINEEIEKIMKK